MFRKIGIAIVGIVMIAPALAVGAGTWGNDAQLEPSSALDRDFMWPDAPKGARETKLYFNLHSVNSFGAATVGTGQLKNNRVGYLVGERMTAFLGYWRDCNGDNYIGSKLLGRDNYPSALLDAAGQLRCPAGSQSLTNPVTSFDQRFNDGVTTKEFVWLAPRNDEASEPLGTRGDARDVTDADVRVWADRGLPTETAASDVLLGPPFPRNSLRDGNSLLGYVSYLQFCNNPDVPSAPAKACFGGTTGASASPLLVTVGLPLLPSPVNGASAVLWTVKERYNDSETSDDWGSTIVDPRDGGACRMKDDPTTWRVDASGSVMPAVNAFWQSRFSTDGSCSEKREFALTGASGPAAGVHFPANLEMDDPFDTSPSAGGKRAVDNPLRYSIATRYDLSAGALKNTPAGMYTNVPIVAGYPFTTGSYNGVFTRLRNTPLECDAASYACRSHLVGYAKVGPSTLDASGAPASAVLPTRAATLGAYRYGSENCNQATQLPHVPKPGYPGVSATHWNCSQAAWDAALRRQTADVKAVSVTLYATYDLRDVDCFDGSVGTHLSTPANDVSLGPAAGQRTSTLAQQQYPACA